MKAYENIIRDKVYQTQISDHLARLSHSHSSTSFFPSPPRINSIGAQPHNIGITADRNSNTNNRTIGVKVKSARKGRNSDSQFERLIDPDLDLASLLTSSIYNTTSNNNTTHMLDSTTLAAPAALTTHVTTTKATALPINTTSSTSSSFVQGSEPFNDSVIIMTDRTDLRCSTSQLSIQNSLNYNNMHISNNNTNTATHSISSNNNNRLSMSPLFNSTTPNPESISGMRGGSYSTTKLKYNTLLRK